MSQIHYLPFTPGFLAILISILVIVLILRSVPSKIIGGDAPRIEVRPLIQNSEPELRSSPR